MKIEIPKEKPQEDIPNNEHIMEIYKHHRDVHIKHTYYLTTVSAAAIAFAIHKTSNIGFNISQIPLAIAVILWGLSFLSGCVFSRKYLDTIRTNAEYLEGNPKLEKETDKLAIQAYIWGEIQFYSLIIGGASFLIWHLIEMWLTP